MQARQTLWVGLVMLMVVGLYSSDALAQKQTKGGPPDWAPAHGYREKTRHIYFSDYNFYFDLEKKVYIYLSGDNWQVSAQLPSVYAKIDLGHAAQVELAINTDTPQKHNAKHLAEYHQSDNDGKHHHKKQKKDKKHGEEH